MRSRYTGFVRASTTGLHESPNSRVAHSSQPATTRVVGISDRYTLVDISTNIDSVHDFQPIVVIILYIDILHYCTTR